jgi:hypothetical protein
VAMSWMAMSDNTSLTLRVVASLQPGAGQSSAASSLVAYWAAALHISLVAHLRMSIGAQKGGVSYTSHMPLLDAPTTSPLGS